MAVQDNVDDAPPPPKQLVLGDLSVKQLSVLIKALGGEAELTPNLLEKRELVTIATSVLAAAPLGLIDDVTAALGLSGLQDVGSRAPVDGSRGWSSSASKQ